MKNYLYPMVAALAFAFVAPFAQSASAQGEHAGHFTKCAKVCADCQLTCDACFAHCLTMTAEGHKDHAKMAQMCADCCKTCAGICARGGPLARTVMECCAKCCDECCVSCEKVTGDKHMAACAKACKDCGKECRDMLAMVGK